MKQNNREFKELLVYLYIQFEGKNNLILDEIVTKKLKCKKELTPVSIKKYLKDNNVKLSDYCVFFETHFPKRLKEELIHPILIIKKK